MSIIKNTPQIKNGLIRAVREQLEHRATWLYLLCDEARKKDLPPQEYAPAAIRRCGLQQGSELVKKGGTTSLKGLKKTLFGLPARMVFEMKIVQCTDDNLAIDFHYCPLLHAWQKQGCSDAEMAELCDIAMCGDRGIAEAYGCELQLPQTLAHGGDTCQIRFVRKQPQP